jgi:hypothetical protein
MATKKSGSLLLSPNYTEDTVGFALESFLSLLSFPRRRFSIEPFSRGKERWLGADARLEGRLKSFKPFYMQFKRPFAYAGHSKARIIKDRLGLNLDASPHALFFGLHPKKPHHADFQHNVLFRLRRRLLKLGIGDAAYVCPLFLDRAAYRSNLHLAGLRMWPRFWRVHPWEMEELLLHTGPGAVAVNFSAVPVLREHITIPPHAQVADASHSYSFTESGDQVCFHSPISLPDSQSSLADFLVRVSGAIGRQDGFIYADGASEMLSNLLYFSQEDEQPLGISFPVGDGDGVSRWQEFGRVLRTDFGIEQYAFVNWND